MRRLSLNARRAHDEPVSPDVEIALIHITHPALTHPIRLSTDPTVRLSVDPLAYGTRSTWMGADPLTEPYLFVLVSAELPSDLEDAPSEATLVLEAVTNDIARLLRSFTSRPLVSMAVVLASSPDLIETQYRDLRLVSSDGTASEVEIGLSRQPIEEEPFPSIRFTKDRFPGLHRT
ncbi:hypothetical protein [Frigidibacter oleivorans]|uniref:hypothetical protein n=1 Tax=Frigidibacter oleivorans TaxID=2487129 RepID=UPI000F8C3D62|nr:hypothetical protein [Frigidibacter oleivorans]